MFKTLRSGKTIVLELWLRKNLYYISIRTKGSKVKQIRHAKDPRIAINLALENFNSTRESLLDECLDYVPYELRKRILNETKCNWCGRIITTEYSDLCSECIQNRKVK